MTSVERVLEYTEIEPEAATDSTNLKPPPNWPSTGSLEFKDMCLSYSKDADNVLKNINVTINDKEKVSHFVLLTGIYIY